MPQKRGEVVERVPSGQIMSDIYESWLKNQVDAELEDKEEEDDVDRAEDFHEKAILASEARPPTDSRCVNTTEMRDF